MRLAESVLPASPSSFHLADRLTCCLCAAALVLATAHGANAREQTFSFPIRHGLRAAGASGSAPAAYTRERVGDKTVSVLGVTGRTTLSRRAMWVDEGGQLFIEATIPESLADRPRVLDVYVEDPRGRRSEGGGLTLRGSIHYDPTRKPYKESAANRDLEDPVYKPEQPAPGTRRVSQVFVFPDLPVGPVMTEVQVRGASAGDWQEIVTEPVVVPSAARLHFGFALDGTDPRNQVPVELVVEARRAEETDERANDAAVTELLSRRVTAASALRWQELDQDLAKLAGKRVRFAFRSRPVSAAGGGAPGVVWGAPSVDYDEIRHAYPLVLLVSLDSLRTSAMGLYSSSTATPFLREFFGKDGAVMLQASTQAVTTLPAHMSLMTALNPSVHGVVDETRALAPSIPTLAEALRKDGWHTVAFTEGGALAGEFGFRRGFDYYDEGSATEVSPSTADALERAAEWLEEYSGGPLFLFVHSYRTRPVHTGEDAGREAVRQRQIGAYVEQVRSADRALRDLFEVTNGRVVKDDSLYVVTSGHGEEFYEHGAAGHGTHLYEESMHVPLLLRGGGVARAGRYDTPVGLIDLAPTILDLADVDVPSGMQGRSFYRVVHNGRSVDVPYRFAEARRPLRLLRDGSLEEWGPPAYAVREGFHKVIYHPAGNVTMEAYDLAADRRELRDLADLRRPPAWVSKLEAVARSYPTVAAKTVRQRPSAVQLSRANRSRLQSLGYLQ